MKYSQNGRGQGHVTYFSGVGEDTHFKCFTQVNFGK